MQSSRSHRPPWKPKTGTNTPASSGLVTWRARQHITSDRQQRHSYSIHNEQAWAWFRASAPAQKPTRCQQRKTWHTQGAGRADRRRKIVCTNTGVCAVYADSSILAWICSTASKAVTDGALQQWILVAFIHPLCMAANVLSVCTQIALAANAALFIILIFAIKINCSSKTNHPI